MESPNNTFNEFGQPIGLPVAKWVAPPQPLAKALNGDRCRLEPLRAEQHGAGLHRAFSKDIDGRSWTYLQYGPFPDQDSYVSWLRERQESLDPMFFVVCDQERQPLGIASYLRIAPAQGCIEIGHLNFSPLLQRTPLATEAMYLMIKNVFELGYRRCEWKCDALNAPSRSAAQRLGFQFEGIFRQATVYKGRNRDTAWFSIVDQEWPKLQQAFEAWLHPRNFTSGGLQVVRLSDLTRVP